MRPESTTDQGTMGMAIPGPTSVEQYAESHDQPKWIMGDTLYITELVRADLALSSTEWIWTQEPVAYIDLTDPDSP